MPRRYDLPADFEVVQQDTRDPWDILREEGWTATNGYRTAGDTARIRAQGYTPAQHSRHLEGDAVDLDHPGMSHAQQVARLHELFGDWQDARVIDEGHHRHLQLPGWGAAPGTPGTANSGLPEIPDDLEIVQRGNLAPNNFMTAAPPPAPTPTPPPPPPAPLPQWTSDDEVRNRIQSLLPQARAPRRRFAGTPAAHQQFAATTETGNVPDDARTMRATTTDDPALSGVNGQLRAMYLDRQFSVADMAAFVGERGISPAQIPNWSRTMAMRPQYLAARPEQRGPLMINLDDIQRRPEDQGDVVVTQGPLPPHSDQTLQRDFRHAEATEYHPGITERAGTQFGHLVTALGGDRRAGVQAGHDADALLSNPLSPVQAVEYAGEASERQQRALSEGRILDAEGHGLDAAVASLGVIPIFGRARAGAALARDALAEAESLALRYGAGEGDDALAAVVRERWAELPEDVRGMIAGAPGSDGAAVGAADIAALRQTANQPSLLERGVARVRRALGGRTAEEAAPVVDAAAARQVDRIDVGDMVPVADGAVTDEAARGRVRPLGAGARYAVEDAPAQARAMQLDEVLPDPAAVLSPEQEREVRASARAFAGDDAVAPETLPTGAYIERLRERGDVRGALDEEAMRLNNNFEEGRRGVVTHEETQRLADEYGFGDLMSRRRGQADNASQLAARRNYLAATRTVMNEAADAAVGGSDAAKLEFGRAWTMHVAVMEDFLGARAEAGRALNILRTLPHADIANYQQIRKMLDATAGATGGVDNLEAVAAMVAGLKNDPAAASRIARLAMKPGFADKVYEMWISLGLLSNPVTHARNIVGNTASFSLQLPEHALASLIGRIRSPTGKNTNRILGVELWARGVGMRQGLLEDALPAFARAIRTGEASDFVDKYERAGRRAISGLKGEIIRAPLRALTAEDEFFKAIATRAELTAQAARKGYLEGARGDDLVERMNYLVANPTDEMVEAAADHARYLTYQNDLGAMGSKFQAWANAEWAAGIRPLKFVVPFIRTTGNIGKYAAHRSPLAFLGPTFWGDFRAGGARRDLAIAKVSLGSAIGGGATMLASDGIITGAGPADPSARRLLMADGWQPYSIRFGDRYVSYRGIEPYATMFGVAADLVGTQEYLTDRQQENAAGQIFRAVMGQITSKTYLTGLGNLMEAVQNPEQFGENYLSNLAGTVVPAFVAGAAPIEDPVLRETRTMLDRVMSRIPGLSDNLPARHDIWGREIVREGAVGPDYISPFRQSTRRNDPVTRELLDAGVSLSYPQRRVAGVELSADEYDRYSALAGQYLRTDAEALVQSDDWADMDQGERRRAFNSIKNAARRDAREDLMLGDQPDED